MQYVIFFSQKGLEPITVNEEDGKRAIAAKINKGIFSHKGCFHDTHFITNIVKVEAKPPKLSFPEPEVKKPVSKETLMKTKQELISKGIIKTSCNETEETLQSERSTNEKHEPKQHHSV